MGFLQDLLGFNPKHQAALERRAKGDTLAMQAHTTARSAARGAGASTAARAQDQGVSPALAARIGAQVRASEDAAASQAFVPAHIAEKQRAEDQIGEIERGRNAFRRQLLGGLIQTGGQLGQMLGSQGGDAAAAQGRDVKGDAIAKQQAALGQPPAAGQGVTVPPTAASPQRPVTDPTLQGILGTAAPAVGMAVGGPAGAAVGSQLAGGGQQGQAGSVMALMGAPVPTGASPMGATPAVAGGPPGQAPWDPGTSSTDPDFLRRLFGGLGGFGA